MNKKMMVLLLGFLLVFSSVGPMVSAAGLFDLFGGMAGGDKDKYRVSFVEGDKNAEDEILLIRIKGVIKETDDVDSMPFEIRKDMMDSLKKDVETAVERPGVKAVLVEIDSPGGEVTASDIMHHQLSKIKKAKKVVVALIGTLGASGGYYVACAAEQIYAHPTSILGSIGVLMQAANIQKLAETIGFKSITLKSDRTPKKDIFSPFREMTPEERNMLVTLIDGIYDRFVQIVADGRKKKIEEVIPLADGSIYSAQQALKNGLIDGIGYREDVLEQIKKLANLKEIKLVKRKTKKGFAEMISEIAEFNSGAPALIMGIKQILEESETPKALYQFKSPLK